MKKFLLEYVSHKELYFAASTLGGAAAAALNFFKVNTPNEILGISISLWFIVFIINLYDIHTGIKADTARQKKDGLDFVFKSGKGWRAFEKVFVFMMVIWFLYYFEKELVKNNMLQWACSALLVIRLFAFFYVVLIELQSIGENNEVRYGKKEKFFLLLDDVIGVVNDGVIGYVKSKFSSTNKDNHE